MKPGTETTVEEWEERFQRDVKGRPGWSVMPIEMLFSQAYRSLSGSAQLALQFALSQVSWEKKSKRPGKRKNLRNDTVYLPTNALIALGIKSSSTRTTLRKQLVETGFLDVKVTGSYLNCAVFKLSGRWRYYPNGDYKPQDQPPAGISMGHRFEGKSEDEEFTENYCPRSKNERKRDSFFERKGYPEKPPEDDSLRLEIERKPLRSENERTVLCTMAKRSGDEQGPHVQLQKKDHGEGTEVPAPVFSQASEEDNQDSHQETHLTPSLGTAVITDEVLGDVEPVALQHQWFIDSFSSACTERGVEPDLSLPASLASALDEWITTRLNKTSYFGNKRFHDEKPSNIQEKITEIISEWESIEILYLGERLQIPSVPALEFLVTYREAIFSWVAEQRQRSQAAILSQMGILDHDASSAGYPH